MVSKKQLLELIETTKEDLESREGMARNLIKEYESELENIKQKLDSSDKFLAINSLQANDVKDRLMWTLKYADEGRIKLRLLKELLHWNL